MARPWIAMIVALSANAAYADGPTGLLTDPSFEESPPGTPIGGTTSFASTGIWTIDEGSIREAESGIVPYDGLQMLRFTQLTCCSDDVYQLLEVDALPSAVEFSAYFNATQAHAFRINILAYEECCLPLGVGAWDQNAGGADLESDGDLETWEQVTLRYALPRGATYIAVCLNSTVDGTVCYADAVSLIGVTLCPADLDGDGSVGFGDLTILLGNWGACKGGCASDLDGDESVGFNDLTVLLGTWGQCDR